MWIKTKFRKVLKVWQTMSLWATLSAVVATLAMLELVLCDDVDRVIMLLTTSLVLAMLHNQTANKSRRI
jgi:hypothetical protein